MGHLMLAIRELGEDATTDNIAAWLMARGLPAPTLAESAGWMPPGQISELRAAMRDDA